MCVANLPDATLIVKGLIRRQNKQFECKSKQQNYFESFAIQLRPIKHRCLKFGSKIMYMSANSLLFGGRSNTEELKVEIRVGLYCIDGQNAELD